MVVVITLLGLHSVVTPPPRPHFKTINKNFWSEALRNHQLLLSEEHQLLLSEEPAAEIPQVLN